MRSGNIAWQGVGSPIQPFCHFEFCRRPVENPMLFFCAMRHLYNGKSLPPVFALARVLLAGKHCGASG